MSKTREFRVGDRVVCKASRMHPYGKTGTIVYIDGVDIGVEFDGYFDGHTLGGRIKSQRGWYVLEDHIKHIPKFKVGDKVRVLDGKYIPNYTGCWNMNGEIGKIRTIREVMEHKFDGCIGYFLEGTWYIFDERGLELVEEKDVKPTTKYKVGDRVRVRKDLIDSMKDYKMEHDESIHYSALGGMLDLKGKDVTIKEIDSVGAYGIVEYSCHWTDEMFEGLTSECEKQNKGKIVIYCEGRHVIANNTETGETAKATCHPDDKFDFNIGAKLAFERLMNSTKIVKQDKYAVGDRVKFRSDLKVYHSYGGLTCLREMVENMNGKEVTISHVQSNGGFCVKECKYGFTYDPEMLEGKIVSVKELKKEEPKLYNGKVVCVNNIGNESSYTVGKIYEFKDGLLTCDTGTKYPLFSPVHSFKEWSEWTSAKFIEVVE